MFAAGMIVFVAVGGAAAFFLWKVSKELPDYEVLAKYEPPVMTRIHANDGNLIAEFARERRIYVPFTAVPERLLQAFISAEDKNFYQHGGLDIQGIMRALVTNLNNVQAGRRVVGASTITQQVAKNFLLTSDVTIERKLKEAILAIRIERAFTKEQIFELYLNEIYLGAGAYGVAAAAQTYWDKALNELTIADVAYLATLPKAPSNYNPFKYPERAIARRNWVIDRMVENGFVSHEDGETAKAQPLGVQARTFGPKIFASEYFAEEVRREILDVFGEDKLYGGGLSVRTTLDPQLQRVARKALVDGLVAYDHRRGGWRGPLKKMELAGDWGKTLGAMPVWSDIDPWRLAVVLDVSKDKAVVGLRPGRTVSGALIADREQGVIPFEDVKWARPKLERGLGGNPTSMTQVLKPGDVIYVSPRAPTEDKDGKAGDPENVKGQWSLQQVPKISGGLVAMDPHTGRILAIAGGFSFAESQFDRATQARRQPGSSFKPLIYATALDNGYTPSSIIVDGRICLDQGAGMPQWCPKNYDAGSAAGPSTLRFGIEKSRNLMTVRLARDMGMPIIGEYARRFGVYDNLMPALSMALGAGETTLMRMVTGYSMVANGGKQVQATLIDRVQDRYGRTIWRHDNRDCQGCDAREWKGQAEPELAEDRKQVLDPMTAFQITEIMEGVVQRGTAQKLKVLNRPIAGKTGTTNDEKDAWFIGFTPDLVVGVYIGFDNPSPMGHGETGGNVAAPVFRDFVQTALVEVPPVPFRAPPGIKLIRVNHKTGLPASPGDKTAIMEAFKPGQEPYGSPPAEAEGMSGEEGAAMAADGYEQQPPPDGFGPPPGAAPGPGPMSGPMSGPPPGYPMPPAQQPGYPVPPDDDRALTSGTGGLY
ncbi:MAG: penicillin-binding protein 1A [Methyloceanibacter sp.]|uniref:penicillin-binding protein 1A n=1 Tax=Methyloceanibacter sp. TaxID=1965321 RepID=UPI003D9ACF87